MTDSVTVRYWAGARRVAGTDSETVQAGALGQLLDELGGRSPELKRVLAASSILVNAAASHSAQSLQAGDIVDVLPPFAGG